VRIWWPWIPSDPKTHSNMSLKILISFSLSIQYFIILLLLQINAAKVKSVIAFNIFIIG
jgi:hypothetical protein